MRVFKAWIDERGGNVDRWHGSCKGCRHARLIDFETNRYRIVLRLIYRRWPPYLHIIPFISSRRGIPILRLGRP